MKKLILINLVVAMVSTLGFADGQDRGGGQLNVCYDANGGVQSVELMDFYEGRIRRINKPMPMPANLQYSDYLKIVLDRYSKIDPIAAERYRIRARTFESEMQLEPHEVLQKIADNNSNLNPRNGCSVEQFAIQYFNIKSDEKRYLVSEKLWGLPQTTELVKAQLVLHEVIYRDANSFGDKNSDSTRYLNFLLFSESMSALTSEEYISTMHKIGFVIENDLSFTGELQTAYGTMRYFLSSIGVHNETCDYKYVKKSDYNCQTILPTNQLVTLTLPHNIKANFKNIKSYLFLKNGDILPANGDVRENGINSDSAILRGELIDSATVRLPNKKMLYTPSPSELSGKPVGVMLGYSLIDKDHSRFLMLPVKFDGMSFGNWKIEAANKSTVIYIEILGTDNVGLNGVNGRLGQIQFNDGFIMWRGSDLGFYDDETVINLNTYDHKQVRLYKAELDQSKGFVKSGTVWLSEKERFTLQLADGKIVVLQSRKHKGDGFDYRIKFNENGIATLVEENSK